MHPFAESCAKSIRNFPKSLTSGLLTGSAGLVSMTADYLALPVSQATGDQFTFVTTPPQWSAVDLAEALAELQERGMSETDARKRLDSA